MPSFILDYKNYVRVNEYFLKNIIKNFFYRRSSHQDNIYGVQRNLSKLLFTLYDFCLLGEDYKEIMMCKNKNIELHPYFYNFAVSLCNKLDKYKSFDEILFDEKLSLEILEELYSFIENIPVDDILSSKKYFEVVNGSSNYDG